MEVFIKYPDNPIGAKFRYANSWKWDGPLLVHPDGSEVNLAMQGFRIAHWANDELVLCPLSSPASFQPQGERWTEVMAIAADHYRRNTIGHEWAKAENVAFDEWEPDIPDGAMIEFCGNRHTSEMLDDLMVYVQENWDDLMVVQSGYIGVNSVISHQLPVEFEINFNGKLNCYQVEWLGNAGITVNEPKSGLGYDINEDVALVVMDHKFMGRLIRDVPSFKEYGTARIKKYIREMAIDSRYYGFLADSICEYRIMNDSSPLGHTAKMDRNDLLPMIMPDPIYGRLITRALWNFLDTENLPDYAVWSIYELLKRTANKLFIAEKV